MKFELNAYGKINLGLDVLRKREDGYHEVKMIMQTVKVFDRLTFSDIEEDRIELSSNLSFIPLNQDNLVYRACEMIRKEYGIEKGVKIYLDKHIPVAAGMAGGSADAAAALIGMNKLFGLKISQKKLMEYGVKLGADVPYCIMRGTALSEGIGEVLTKLPPMPRCFILIAKPPISVSTKMVYENLHVDRLAHHPDIDGMVDALRLGDLTGITDRMENVLETVTVARYPEIEIIKKEMLNGGALNSLMSGSGPTVFGVYDSEVKARNTMAELRNKELAKQTFVVLPFNVA
ncbi:MAG: 4-(cytidine 5'-diphospho)-2-C-methyl-D-erythritol kinase [Coprococcus sp.]